MRCYAWLLRLLPREFRVTFGADMQEVFEDHRRVARSRGPGAQLTLWSRTVIDISLTAWREHRRRRPFPVWSPHMLLTDLSHALRLVSRYRGFSIAVMLTIALGVGATTSVFAVVNALMIRALPYPHADRLLRVFEYQDQEGFSGSLALGNLDDWCSAPGLEACGAYITSDLNLAGGENPERVRGAVATPGFFTALGIEPARGRLFTTAELDTKAPVIVVAEAASARLFAGADPIGRTLLLDGARYDVIGVAPNMPGFDDIAVWRGASTVGQSRQNHANRGIARRRDGVSLTAVQSQLDGISRALQTQQAATNAHWWGKVEPLQASLTAGMTTTFRALGALTTILLLLCAASAASLVAGRSATRARELSVRLALGASHGRIVTQLFIESAVLALGGAVLGIALAAVTINSVMAILPPRLVLWRTPGTDAASLAFAVAAALVSSLAFGLLPAIGLARRSRASASLQARFTSVAGHRTRAVLTALQTGLATVLLVAAALLGTVMMRVLFTDPGFAPNNVLSFNVTAPRAGYADAPALLSLFERLGERLAHLPGVMSSGAVFNLPLSGSSVQRGVIRMGEALPARGHARLVLFQVSTPGYLQTLGLHLLDGRDFSATDSADGQPVALVNERLATALWPGQRAVGQQLLVHTDETIPRTVVGVIADAHQARLDETIAPEYYVPLAQSPRRTMTYVLRSNTSLTRAAIQAELSAVDPSLPVYELTTIDSLFERGAASRRSITQLAIFFSVTALLLAAVGLFGLVASGIAERTREIGVRMALGASPSSVLRLVSRRGLAMALTGTAVGLAATVPVARLLGSLLTDAPPSNLQVMLSVSATLLAVAALACWLPALAALRVDPVNSLRSE